MPTYMIERRFAEQLEMSSEDVTLLEEINADEGVSWLFSFLSADRHRTYCLYEAPSPDAIITAARRAGTARVEVNQRARQGRCRKNCHGWSGSLSEKQLQGCHRQPERDEG